MTEHMEKMVREWRAKGVDPLSAAWIITVCEFLDVHPAEFVTKLNAHVADINKTLYGK